MLQESKEQTRSIIVCVFGFALRKDAACMRVCWELGKRAVSVLAAGKEPQKLDCLLYSRFS